MMQSNNHSFQLMFQTRKFLQQAGLYCTLKHLFLYMLILAPGTLLAQKEYYTPKALLIPLHDQKNQLHISIGRGGGYDLNLSYSFTDKFALFQTASFDNGLKKRTSIMGDMYHVKRNDYVLKGGLGYFHKPESSWFSTIETYFGAGFSKIYNNWNFENDAYQELKKAK